MFETMIHSTEELNAMAVHLRLSENFSELKLLASEWLVPEEYVQDFIAGKRAQLAEIPFEEREYDSAVEKLRAEMWLIKDQMFTDIVSKYLIRKAEDNPVFGMQVLQKHKTITGEFPVESVYVKGKWKYPAGAFHGAAGGPC